MMRSLDAFTISRKSKVFDLGGQGFRRIFHRSLLVSLRIRRNVTAERELLNLAVCSFSALCLHPTR